MHDQRTFFAFWIPGGAAIPAEEDDAVAEVGAFLWGQDGAKLFFNLFRFLALAEAKTAADADAVGITDHTSGGAIKVTQQEVGGFAAYAGDPKQGIHGVRNLPTVIVQEHLASQDNIPGFVLVKADRRAHV